MNAILIVPLVFRLAALFAVGIVAGCFVNWGAYALAWNPRRISPWSRPDPGRLRLKRHLIPVAGWLFRRQEAAEHGDGFWVRPLLVELGMGAVFAWLYWLEVGWWGGVRNDMGLLPPLKGIQPAGFLPASDPVLMLHVQYACHVLLIVLMTVASLIDIDEKTIPDMITIPGTILFLTVSAIYPWSRLPADVLSGGNVQFQVDFLKISSPLPWPGSFHGRASLGVALACYLTWCFALLHRPWRTRKGILRAFALMFARIARDPFSRIVSVLALVGTIAIVGAWLRGGHGWLGLITALVGMAGGGGLIWAVRLIGRSTLGREAMGFGDVTLMAMIGAFVGWQPSLAVFFLAPFAALLIGGLQWILHKENEIFYGPYLCMATFVVLVRWPAVWIKLEPIFELGIIVPVAVVGCLALMAVLLLGMRAFGGRA